MPKIAVIVIGALLAGCGPRFVPLEIQETWFRCAEHSECTVMEDPRCTLMPINRRYARNFSDWVRTYRPAQVTSEPCAQPRFRYEAVCESQRCSSSLVLPDAADVAGDEPR